MPQTPRRNSQTTPNWASEQLVTSYVAPREPVRRLQRADHVVGQLSSRGALEQLGYIEGFFFE